MFFSDTFDTFTLQWSLKPIKFPKDSKENFGGKVILPHCVLERLVAANAQLPYIFEISHTGKIYKTNAGCLEFTGSENTITVPEWMHQQLDMADINISVRYINLPKGQYVKLLPHSVEFLDIENPKLELEKHLRDYQVLTTGDEILCNFSEIGPIRFTISDVEPSGDGIYIVDTDLSVEFQAPLGYEEKVESERSVMKYVKIEGKERAGETVRRVKFDAIGVYFMKKKDNK